MYSRRTFLKGFVVVIPFLIAPITVLNSIRKNSSNERNGRFIRQGWMLQEGDV